MAVTFFIEGPYGVAAATVAGFRFGPRGTHTSRTLMLDELSATLDAVPNPSAAKRADYAAAIIEGNCLGKATIATRRSSNQRLGELYALDPKVQLFRVLRRLWHLDPTAHRLLALLAALARDPLLRATADPILALPPGADFVREPLKKALRSAVGDRLNDAILAKAVRNVASTWTKSGHLSGRALKKRQVARPSPAAVAFALWLAHTAGFRGVETLSSGWLAVLDSTRPSAHALALEANRLGLIDLRSSGDILELNLTRLDPVAVRT